MTAVLEIAGLTVAYRSGGGAPVIVVRDVDLTLHGGRVLGVAGESGCGKSTAVLAGIGYPSPGAVRLAGSSQLGEIDLLALDRTEMQGVWGRRIGYVAQDAASALNARHRVGRQVAEALELHGELAPDAIRARVLATLDAVGIPDPATAVDRYPWQFSGGEQQRIALAAAMVCEPKVLILDEPTTGLDATTRAQITKLIGGLVRRTGTAALHISHDLAMLASCCDDLAVMYAGEVVERGPVSRVAAAPRHPYSAALLDAIPRIEATVRVAGIPGLPPPQVVSGACAFAPRCAHTAAECLIEVPPLAAVPPGDVRVRCVRAEALGPLRRLAPSNAEPIVAMPMEDSGPVLTVNRLRCSHPIRHDGRVTVVNDISLELARGETLAIVGESGSGKSTLLRAVAGLHRPDSGAVRFHGEALPAQVLGRSREVRRAIQMVFQNPDASLNPMHSIWQTVERPLVLFRPDLDRAARRDRVLELLGDVRLDPGVLTRRPHELSGGQRQRVALARAFAADPQVMLCDEVVSALDVSVQATVLDVLTRLATGTGTALLFVTHDLGVVRQVADRVAIVRAGAVCEVGTVDRILAAPEHPYTQELLAAVPRLDSRDVA